jgi:hypothetical protein
MADIVYRVEHAETLKGPYRETRDYLMALRHHSSATGHPSPWDSGEPFDILTRHRPDEKVSKFYFGFLDLEDLRQWFQDAIDDPFSSCWDVAVYQSEDVVLGGSGQVAFIIDDTTRYVLDSLDTF